MRRRSAAVSHRLRRPFAPGVQGLECRRLMTIGVPPVVGDFGFEAVSAGVGEDAFFRPSGQVWAYSGPSGISANGTHFTSGNLGSPQGGQVAYLMGAAAISQEVEGWEAGAYAISFKAAQRGNYAGAQTVQVKVDGEIVGTFTPSGKDYERFTTAAFVVTAGSHTVTFAGPVASEATVFLDEVSVAVAVPVVGDSGFESVAMAAGTFGRPSSGSAWSFSPYGAGVSANDSAFTSLNPDAPEGGRVAYLQSDIASISQDLTGWRAGSYTIAFKAAQRHGNAQTIQVKLDGDVVATLTPIGMDYQSYQATFTVPAGPHVLTLSGTVAGDHTAFVDDVLVFATPTPPTIGDPSFETPSAGVGEDAFLRPSGQVWAYSGPSGVSANSTHFTSGNPDAPAGGQVAYLMGAATISQQVEDWEAGAYMISFQAAQRGNYAGAQTIRVKVDGEVVGVFTPEGPEYQTFTADFAVMAGAHTITFAGTSTGVDTAFLDAVTIAAAVPVVRDSGFETDLKGGAWQFYDHAGVAEINSPYRAGEPIAPQADQVAFLRGRSRIAQPVAGWQAGTYVISFKAAQSAYGGLSSQSIRVTVDGDVVGAFTPSGSGYETFVTNAFEVIDGRHTVSITGLDASDRWIALVDDVRIIPAAGRPGTPGGGSIVWNATIRDFPSTHPDFQVDAGVTVDRGLVAATLGPDGLPVFVGPDGTAAITNASTFNQWFRTTDGVNREAPLPLAFAETAPGSGVYEFADESFFPIDGRLLGDEGGSLQNEVGVPHNFLFTLHLRASISYRGGESLTFTSDDALWVFLDGRLVLDLGGLHPAATGIVSLDSLGLSTDEPHTLDVFFAERRTGNSVLRVQTTASPA